jgi:hypothetical protein
MTRKKTSTTTRSPETPVTFTVWKLMAGAALAESHGMRAGSIREARWRNWFIQGRSPAEAAAQAATEYESTRPVIEQKRRR